MINIIIALLVILTVVMFAVVLYCCFAIARDVDDIDLYREEVDSDGFIEGKLG